MTRTLRDQIAAAIEEERNKWAGGDAASETLADAVIESLNLNMPVEYMSVDRQRRNFMVAGHYTVEVTDE